MKKRLLKAWPSNEEIGKMDVHISLWNRMVSEENEEFARITELVSNWCPNTTDRRISREIGVFEPDRLIELDLL